MPSIHCSSRFRAESSTKAKRRLSDQLLAQLCSRLVEIKTHARPPLRGRGTLVSSASRLPPTDLPYSGECRTHATGQPARPDRSQDSITARLARWAGSALRVDRTGHTRAGMSSTALTSFPSPSSPSLPSPSSTCRPTAQCTHAMSSSAPASAPAGLAVPLREVSHETSLTVGASTRPAWIRRRCLLARLGWRLRIYRNKALISRSGRAQAGRERRCRD